MDGAVGAGGSFERGGAVLHALIASGHDVVPVVLDPGSDPVAVLGGAGIDVAFLALDPRSGSDACVRSVLEWLGIPYTGSSPLATALAADKLKAKELFRLHNVPTPPYYVVEVGQGGADLADIHGSFGFPVMVKARRSSAGVSAVKASNLLELAAALERLFARDDAALVERYIAGRELRVGLLGRRVLGVLELAPEHNGTSGSRALMPARLGGARQAGVLNLGERAASALDTDGAVCVDLLVTEGQNEYVLGVDALPALEPGQPLPLLGEAAGYDLSALCEAVLSRARSPLGAAEAPRATVVPFPSQTIDDAELARVAPSPTRRAFTA